VSPINKGRQPPDTMGRKYVRINHRVELPFLKGFYPAPRDGGGDKEMPGRKGKGFYEVQKDKESGNPRHQPRGALWPQIPNGPKGWGHEFKLQGRGKGRKTEREPILYCPKKKTTQPALTAGLGAPMGGPLTPNSARTTSTEFNQIRLRCCG